MPATDAPTADESQDYSLRRIRILIVGGGATGQAYGYHLLQAGAYVAYYLKPRHAPAARQGFTLHRFGIVGYRGYKIFDEYDIYTSPEEVQPHHFDQIWLCISSPALRSGVVDRLDAVNPGATWVMLQPGLEDKEYMLERIPAERLVTGMVGMIAYQAPLPREDLSLEGVAYWLPPIASTLFSGERAEVAASYLRNGGMAAAVDPDVSTVARYSSAALIPFVIALEAHGWSSDWLRKKKESLRALCGAIGETFRAVESATGTEPPSGLPLLKKTWVWKMALFAAPKVSPFPFDGYFRYHFLKVREQTEEMVDEFIALCQEQGVDPACLIGLREHWYAEREAEQTSRRPTQTLRPGSPESRELSDRSLDEAAPPESSVSNTTPDPEPASNSGSGDAAAAAPDRESKKTVPDLPSALQTGAGDQADTIESVPQFDLGNESSTLESLRPSDHIELSEKDLDEETGEPAPVHFRQDLPTQNQGELGREDFVQTELADDEEGEAWRPGGVTDSMQSFGGDEPPMSPGLEEDGEPT